MIINLCKVLRHGSEHIPFLKMKTKGWWVADPLDQLFKMRIAARKFDNGASIYYKDFIIFYEAGLEIFSKGNDPGKVIWINDYSQSAINIEVVLNDY
jgi:hypothetical protein